MSAQDDTATTHASSRAAAFDRVLDGLVAARTTPATPRARFCLFCLAVPQGR